jgi:hypothetical protein
VPPPRDPDTYAYDKVTRYIVGGTPYSQPRSSAIQHPRDELKSICNLQVAQKGGVKQSPDMPGLDLQHLASS